jgi:hypothetical protein
MAISGPTDSLSDTDFFLDCSLWGFPVSIRRSCVMFLSFYNRNVKFEYH